MATLIPDSIDFKTYMQETEPQHRVRPAAAFADEVAEKMDAEAKDLDMRTPWETLSKHFRARYGELTVWTGYKGHGKTTALSQFELCAISQGAKSLKLSMEFSPAETLRKSIVQCSHGTPDAGYRKRWWKWTDGRMWLYDHKGSVDANTVIGVIRYAVENFKVNFVVVDSLMKCGIAPDDFNRQKWFTDALQNICHEGGVQIHLVAHSRKKDDDSKPAQMHDIKGTSEICDMAENVVSHWRNKNKERDACKPHDQQKCRDQADALFVIESQRNGTGWCGAVPLIWNGTSQQYLENYNHQPVDYSRADR